MSDSWHSEFRELKARGPLCLMVEDDVLMNAVESLRVSTREKEPYSVWRKQKKLRKQFERHARGHQGVALSRSDDGILYPLDTIALRIVLDPTKLGPEASEAAKVSRDAAGQALCYHALNLVRSAWRPLKNRTKDYVARPKANGYQSLHTTVLMRLHGASYPFEVQIRTRDMHLVAEYGSAAHALYSSKQRHVAPDAASLFLASPGVAPSVPDEVPPQTTQTQAQKNTQDTEPLEGEAESSALGAQLGESMGARLRAERIFVLASGGRVLTVGANDKAVDVRRALLSDLEEDALVTGTGLWLTDKPNGHLEINGKRLEWLQSLSTTLLNGDEVRWVSHDDDDDDAKRPDKELETPMHG